MKNVTVGDLIDALGGTSAVADLMGKTPGAVSQWRRKGFPTKTYDKLSALLREAKQPAPPELWGME